MTIKFFYRKVLWSINDQRCVRNKLVKVNFEHTDFRFLQMGKIRDRD